MVGTTGSNMILVKKLFFSYLLSKKLIIKACVKVCKFNDKTNFQKIILLTY